MATSDSDVVKAAQRADERLKELQELRQEIVRRAKQTTRAKRVRAKTRMAQACFSIDEDGEVTPLNGTTPETPNTTKAT